MRELTVEGEDIQDFARRLVAAHDLGGPSAVAAMLRQSHKPGFWRYIQEYWINSILSGPHTHAVNMVGNSITGFLAIPERTLGGVISAVSRTRPVRTGGGKSSIPGLVDRLDIDAPVAVGEGPALLYGMMEGLKDGFILAGRTLKEGVPASADQAAKIESLKYRALTASNLGLRERSPLGRSVDLLGNVIRLPGRALLAEDEFFKGVARRMELRAQAYRTASSEGLRGKAFSKRVADIMENPPEDIYERIVDFAQMQTFTKQLGEAGSAIQTALSEVPVARFIVPFIQTPTNILKYVGARTPLAPLSKAVRDDLLAGGARRDMAIAKITMGSLIMAGAVYGTANGFVTGNGPINKNRRRQLKEQGWQPYSVWIGDRWVSYQRLDPLGMTLGIAADMHEILGSLDEVEVVADPERLGVVRERLLEKGFSEDEADDMVSRIAEKGIVTVQDLLGSIAVAVGNNVLSKSYMSGLSDVFEIFNAPSAGYSGAVASRTAERFALGFVPFSSAVRQTKRVVDPALRQADGWIEAFKAMAPGLSEDLPPVLDFWGEEREHMVSVSPFAISVPQLHEASEELEMIGYAPGMPGRTLNGIRLGIEEYNAYVRLSANDAKDEDHGLGFRDSIERLAKGTHPDDDLQEEYSTGTDGAEGSKVLLVRKLIRDYRKLAKGELLTAYPEFRALVDERALFREEARGEG